MGIRFNSRLTVFVLFTLGCASCLGQIPQTSVPGPEDGSKNSPHNTPERRETGSSDQPLAAQRSSGSISGTVVDQSGAVVAGARVRLAGEDQSAGTEVLSNDDGQFAFANVAPGYFHLTITAEGFATQTGSGVLTSGENYVAPKTVMAVATAVTDVEVGLSKTEVAEEQIKLEEKQRVLGVLRIFMSVTSPTRLP